MLVSPELRGGNLNGVWFLSTAFRMRDSRFKHCSKIKFLIGYFELPNQKGYAINKEHLCLSKP